MDNFWQQLSSMNDAVNTFVWVTIGLVLLLGTGVLMTILTKFFQVTHIAHWMKNTIGSIFHKKVLGHTQEKASISQFQALCTALAATVGVGNIAGTATAIVSGGPGAIFWMWVAAFFGMMTNYAENVLGIYYRRKDAHGEWAGGAMYYLRDGLGAKKGCRGIGKFLGALFSVFCVLASFGIGNLSQVNTIVTNVTSVFRVDALSNITLYTDAATGVSVNLYMLVVGLVIMAIAALVIIGGIKRIAAVTEKIVPFMVVLYILGAVAIVVIHFTNILPALGSIFRFAFGMKAVAGGAAGIMVKEVITWGFKRGVFSNEAGLGSSVMVHSASNVKEPVRQGMWGIFEVFADTIVICTLTALVVLTSGLVDLDTGYMISTSNKVVLVSEAFSNVFGFTGAAFVAIAVFLFAFSTVLGWSYYGSRAWQYLFGERSAMIYKVVFVAAIVLGALLTTSLAWDISDTFNGLMMIPNLIGVLALSQTVMKITRNYVARKIKNQKGVELMLSFDEEIQKEQLEKMRQDGEL
ncbi:MAG: alanine/glycine:cation symporter family protein [Oscillospiraceae bacterium]|nr:alanine/glycine:cation symporter family protein [Oscillospiraceae bacterium]